MFKVVEKFVSINGEGSRAGQLAVFIRFAGCNLKCSYCDTAWANREDVSFTLMTSEDIYSYIKSTKVDNVTLTGGEPLLRDGIAELLEFLATDNSLNVEIETNGSVDIRPFKSISGKAPSFTLDYKTESSGMESHMYMENYKHLEKGDTVKFVVGGTHDLEKAKEIITQYDLTNRCNVNISAIFDKIALAKIVDFMKDNNMNSVKLQPQLHKFIWNPEARGV